LYEELRKSPFFFKVRVCAFFLEDSFRRGFDPCPSLEGVSRFFLSSEVLLNRGFLGFFSRQWPRSSAPLNLQQPFFGPNQSFFFSNSRGHGSDYWPSVEPLSPRCKIPPPLLFRFFASLQVFVRVPLFSLLSDEHRRRSTFFFLFPLIGPRTFSFTFAPSSDFFFSYFR